MEFYSCWKCDAKTLVTCLVGVSSEVNVMMSESRQQNTEVRLAVGSIADKIDRLTEKVSCLQRAIKGLGTPRIH